MTKSKLFAIVLSSVCLIISLLATPVYAAECSSDTLAKKRELLDQNAQGPSAT